VDATWARIRHDQDPRARRRRALDGDLPQFKTGSPGGWQPLQGAAALTRCGAQLAGSAAGAWCAPTPPWPS